MSDKKTVLISADKHRAIERARIAAEEKGEKPLTYQQTVEKAIDEYLERHCPEALVSPGRGRPRKTPRKSSSQD